MKRCSKCGETKLLSGFDSNSTHKDGKQSYCRICMRIAGRKCATADPEKTRERSRRWAKNNPQKRRESALRCYRRRRNENYANLVGLFGPACLDCGREYPMQIFHYHHLNPGTKEKSFAFRIGSWEWGRVEVYVRGCVQLCPTCHCLRHYAEWEKRQAVK